MSVQAQRLEEGRAVRLTVEAGPGNVLTGPVIEELRKALLAAAEEREVRAVILAAAGPHFSFGLSVEEHRPAEVQAALTRFHALVRALLDSPVPVVAAVRGQCLGGGLEVVMACSRVVAHPEAKLGQPEIRLGVFAPAASAILPARVGQARAEALLLSGKSVGAGEALAIGLADQLCGAAEDPADAALAWAKESLFAHSPSSLRLATRAARWAFARDAAARLQEMERLYLDELMATKDAVEGVAAFLEKRKPVWTGGRR